MIRAALITIAFLGVTLTLILMQPSSRPSPVAGVTEPLPQTEPEPMPHSTVSRAETDLDALDALTDTPELSAAMTSPDTPEPIAPVVQSQPQQEPEPEITATPDIAASVAALPDQKATPQTASASELERMIINALAQGQSEAYIDALVNDAARKGKVDVPATLVTADGKVDTNSLLAVLSQPPQPEFGPGNTYVVQPGDSLASIAYRFYGSTGHAVDIYMANRSVMASPNSVEPGQVLALPEL